MYKIRCVRVCIHFLWKLWLSVLIPRTLDGIILGSYVLHFLGWSNAIYGG